MFINNRQRNLIVENCTEESEKPKEFQYEHNLYAVVRKLYRVIHAMAANDSFFFFLIRDKYWRK